ncbi:MAG: hypothetical protein H7831_18250, partial [Magnetococcus sp. WYHC-3]
GNFVFNSALGYLHARQTQDGFTESDGTVNAPGTSNFGQITLGSELSRPYDAAEPYFGVTLEWDTTYEKTAAREYDPQGMALSTGLRYYPNENFIAELGLNSLALRRNTTQYGAMLNLRYSF